MPSLAVSTPTPAPPVDVIVNVPTPAPFPTPVVNVFAPDPWVWSLDTAVGLIGALSSMVVAAIAIVVTVWVAERSAQFRRKELEEERERRARAERKLVGEAVGAYWDSIDERGDDWKAHDHLIKSFAEGDLQEEPLYRWVVESGQARFAAYFTASEEADPDPDNPGPPKPSWFTYRAVDAAVRNRLREWVRTGHLDTSPLSVANHKLGDGSVK